MIKKLSERLQNNFDGKSPATSPAKDRVVQDSQVKKPLFMTKRSVEASKPQTSRRSPEFYEMKHDQIRKAQEAKINRTPCPRMDRVANCRTYLDAKDEK